MGGQGVVEGEEEWFYLRMFPSLQAGRMRGPLATAVLVATAATLDQPAAPSAQAVHRRLSQSMAILSQRSAVAVADLIGLLTVQTFGDQTASLAAPVVAVVTLVVAVPATNPQ